MIIDTHVHVFSYPSVEDLADKIETQEDLIAFRTRYPELYKRRGEEHHISNAATLIEHMDRHNINYATIQATIGEIPDEDLLGMVREHPDRLFGLVSPTPDFAVKGYPSDPGWVPEVVAQRIRKGLGEYGFVGVGEIMPRSVTKAIHPEEIAEDFEPIFEAAKEFGVPIQIPTAWTQFAGGLFYGDPMWVDEIAGRYPEVPIILTKMGRSFGRFFEAALVVALRNDHVHFDTAQASPEHIRIAIRKIGAERILFGSDWSCTWRWVRKPREHYANQLAILDEANLTARERELIQWQNANRLFKLGL